MPLLALQSLCIGTDPFAFRVKVQSPFVLLFQAVRMGQQFAHLLPDQLIKPLGSHLLVVADALTTETVGIGSDAAIIRVLLATFAGGFADLFAIVGIAAMPAHAQALKQIGCTAATLTRPLAILLQLFFNSNEQGFTDDRRNWNFLQRQNAVGF